MYVSKRVGIALTLNWLNELRRVLSQPDRQLRMSAGMLLEA